MKKNIKKRVPSGSINPETETQIAKLRRLSKDKSLNESQQLIIQRLIWSTEGGTEEILLRYLRSIDDMGLRYIANHHLLMLGQ